MEKISQYRRGQYEKYMEWSDEAQKLTQLALSPISAGQPIPRQGLAGPLPSKGESRVSVFIFLPWFELGTASTVSNDNGACWPKWLLSVMKPLNANKY